MHSMSRANSGFELAEHQVTRRVSPNASPWSTADRQGLASKASAYGGRQVSLPDPTAWPRRPGRRNGSGFPAGRAAVRGLILRALRASERWLASAYGCARFQGGGSRGAGLALENQMFSTQRGQAIGSLPLLLTSQTKTARGHAHPQPRTACLRACKQPLRVHRHRLCRLIKNPALCQWVIECRMRPQPGLDLDPRHNHPRAQFRNHSVLPVHLATGRSTSHQDGHWVTAPRANPSAAPSLGRGPNLVRSRHPAQLL
jgi:hypothetical protein